MILSLMAIGAQCRGKSLKLLRFFSTYSGCSLTYACKLSESFVALSRYEFITSLALISHDSAHSMYDLSVRFSISSK
jgi:hypothetical protein